MSVQALKKDVYQVIMTLKGKKVAITSGKDFHEMKTIDNMLREKLDAARLNYEASVFEIYEELRAAYGKRSMGKLELTPKGIMTDKTYRANLEAERQLDDIFEKNKDKWKATDKQIAMRQREINKTQAKRLKMRRGLMRDKGQDLTEIDAQLESLGVDMDDLRRIENMTESEAMDRVKAEFAAQYARD